MQTLSMVLLCSYQICIIIRFVSIASRCIVSNHVAVRHEGAQIFNVSLRETIIKNTSSINIIKYFPSRSNVSRRQKLRVKGRDST
jgi:hypothetical protein